jgi:hypothetical protein
LARGCAAWPTAWWHRSRTGRRRKDSLFTEPNLALSLDQRTNGHLRIRVHLSLEALPPSLLGDNRAELYEHLLVFDVSRDTVAAAEEWDNDCAPFPVR